VVFILNIFLFISTLGPSIVSHAANPFSQCSLLFRFTPDENWNRIVVREPTAPRHDDFEGYATRIFRGTVDVFAPWFKTQNPDLSFKEMITFQRAPLVAETPKGPGYNGYFFGHQIFNLLDDKHKMRDGDPRIMFSEGSKFTGEANRYLWQILPIIDLEDGVSTYSTFVHGVQSQGRIRIERKDIFFFYPDSTVLPQYLNKAEELLRSLQKSSPIDDAVKKREFLGTLAHYYQLLVVAHPFPRVNNSVFMAQVNYLLITHGLRGLPHGYLDLAAFVLSTKQFQDYFIQQVELAMSLPENS